MPAFADICCADDVSEDQLLHFVGELRVPFLE
jgi:hypothetical protein